MSKKLFIAVLGKQGAGKTTTWNTLFDAPPSVRTGKYVRPLDLRAGIVDVFLVTGSPEEREQYVGDIIVAPGAKIVLCSVQYCDEGIDTFQYARDHGFEIHTQWLNPGYGDTAMYPDELGFTTGLLNAGHTLSIRDGNGDTKQRIQEIRDKILGWSLSRGLLRPSDPRKISDDKV